MKHLASRFVKDESGTTAMEYGLIAGFVSITIVAALQLMAPELSRLFTAIANGLVAAQ